MLVKPMPAAVREKYRWVAPVLVLLFVRWHGLAQSSDSLYFQNFVHHSNGQACQHTPTATSFVVFLNRDETRILVETAPRWNLSAPPNIPGNGTFGVELANFIDPGVQVGDSVFARFTCVATGQQGTVADLVSGIPWWRFPLTLTLGASTMPNPPQNVQLAVDTVSHHRIITWTTNVGETYVVYRRTSGDTVVDGQERMLYFRMEAGISGGSYTDTTALANDRYGYVVFAVTAAGVVSPSSSEVNEDPVFSPGDDLTVSYIGRLPRLNYIWGSPDPDTDGWPIPGQQVIWQAIVKNWLDTTLSAVPYKWYLDNVPIDSGTVNIPAVDTASVNFPWTWTFVRHELKFVIDPTNIIPEEEERNNELVIYTNAIGVGLYVEQSVHDYFRQYQHELPNVHSNCWEDWAQRQVRRWNQMFAAAVFPETPNGVLDRIRLDKITVVPDGALPLAGGLPSNNPNLLDSTIDLQWGFAAAILNGTFYSDHTSVSDNNAFYYEGSLIHELGHARYLIDVYGFNVDGGTQSVAIQEGGQYIAGTPYMPYVGGTSLYATPLQGLMNGQYTYIDHYSAPALNLIAGHRATFGNCNAPGNIGVFMQDLPSQNGLVVKDAAGAVLPGADVRIYQATGRAGVWYGKYFDDTPDLQFTADSGGAVLLGRCPFSPNGFIEHTYGLSNAIAIVRAAQGGRVGYGFLECSSFNFEFWRGNTSLGNYEIQLNMLEPVSVRVATEPPSEFTLGRNFPNPFNPMTRIPYSIRTRGKVTLRILDVLGREIRTLVSDDQSPGRYEAEWNGRNEKGQTVSSGVYLYQLQSGGFNQVRTLLLLR